MPVTGRDCTSRFGMKALSLPFPSQAETSTTHTPMVVDQTGAVTGAAASPHCEHLATGSGVESVVAEDTSVLQVEAAAVHVVASAAAGLHPCAAQPASSSGNGATNAQLSARSEKPQHANLMREPATSPESGSHKGAAGLADAPGAPVTLHLTLEHLHATRSRDRGAELPSQSAGRNDARDDDVSGLTVATLSLSGSAPGVLPG